MSDKTYIVEGRQFRTEADYRRACRDRETIEKLRTATKGGNIANLKKIKTLIKSGKIRFYTPLGQDFEDEIDELIKNAERTKGGKSKKAKNSENNGTLRVKNSKTPKSIKSTEKNEYTGKSNAEDKSKPVTRENDTSVDSLVAEELKNREKKRKLIIALCSVAAIGCLGYLMVYSYYIQRTNATYEQWSNIKNMGASNSDSGTSADSQVVIHYDNGSKEAPEVLDEYKNLLNKNKKLIGWVKIDDTNIDYPVMQTTDNEYYLDHNLNQEYDKNGSIFMDKDCDVLKPSTNFILYGHHMKSGQMFGGLDKYQDQSYAEEHPYISFDTIYEHGTYQVMYVFRSRVYSEEDVNFKYYQFIDALSETEFDSNMQEMAAMSLYDTGVTAEYGDRLLTLSTCDYQEKNGRFVVVAKKIN